MNSSGMVHLSSEIDRGLQQYLNLMLTAALSGKVVQPPPASKNPVLGRETLKILFFGGGRVPQNLILDP